MIVNDHGTHFRSFGLGGVLAKGFGPKAITVTIVVVGEETDVAGRGDEFLHAAEIVAEFGLRIDAELAVFERIAESEREFFFKSSAEMNGLDSAAEAIFGALG
jgi:hypothetical protein